jgi:phospho-N-acetylmuramoyl-pentapeptide-transferase
MLFHLLFRFHETFSFLNVTRYITFRTAAASLTALAISLVLGPWMIRKLRDFRIGQIIRQEGPESHRVKAGTPTMGGLLILASAIVPTLLWTDLTSPYIWIAVLATVGFGAVGFADDYLKLTRRSHHGLRPLHKLGGLVVIALGVGFAVLALSQQGLYNTRLIFPFFKDWIPDLGWAYVPFAAFVLVAWSNAVNLTDGLDGLAISTFGVAAATYTALAYVTGHAVLAEYLLLVRFPVGELTIFCGALVGASLGFLWYNAHPAEIFMGDVGSLALGGALGTVAILIKQELLLVIVGGVFVLDAASVVLQVGYFKATGGRRLFLMSPLHHHFEKLGWAEPKIITRFLIVSVIFALFSLTTLKLR